MARTTGGRMSCDRKKKEMSLFRQGPNLYAKRLRPEPAREPMMTATREAPMEARMLFSKRWMNSSRTVEISPMVSGERPRERHPFQEGVKSTQGIRWPWVTSTATLKEVVTVQ